jgi:hypothetical protein
MENIEWLRARVRLLVKDVTTDDNALDEIIKYVINELALETRIFKKLYGFTVHKEIEKYNFKYMARLNEQVEEEPSEITFADPDFKEIIEFIANGEFPTPITEKKLEIEEAKSSFIDLLDIFDEYGCSVMHKFEERGSSYYFCYDKEWRYLNDDRKFVFAAWVTPDINELHHEDLLVIAPTIIAGCKFYINDLLHSSADVQATNYDYMRWFNGKKQLMDKFPTAVYSTKEDRRWQF